jgi:hypothetical protein
MQAAKRDCEDSFKKSTGLTGFILHQMGKKEFMKKCVKEYKKRMKSFKKILRNTKKTRKVKK